jgi:putative sugar O-methyltransferase
MASYSLSKSIVDRFSEFMNSAEYRQTSDYAKSDYWEYHARNISVAISNSTITVEGMSGYYVPPLKNSAATFKNRAITGWRNPGKIIDFMAAKYRQPQAGKHVRLLDYYNAFDAVMAQDPVTEIESAPYRIDFRALSQKSGVVTSVEEMKRVFFARDKYQLNPQMVYAYYIANVLNGYLSQKPKAVMEIGAGNGNLASLLHHTLGSTYIIVDLPETLCLSIPHLASLFPDGKILMPHESRSYDINAYDFIFLTPDQTKTIADNSIDLSISTAAFQEMTHRQIAEYLELIQRVGHEGSHFLCSSRVEKIPAAFVENKAADIPINRFAEYPWNPNNKIVIYEICRFLRLVQLDNIYIRLERISKDGHEK